MGKRIHHTELSNKPLEDIFPITRNHFSNMVSGPASYLSGITFLFKKGHWSRVVLQLYDCYCKILLADVYSPMKGDWAIYIRPHFVRGTFSSLSLNDARLGQTLFIEQNFCIFRNHSRQYFVLERPLSDV